jgi:hypothetical protein
MELEKIYKELVRIRECLERQEQIYYDNMKKTTDRNKQAEKVMKNTMENLPDNLKPVVHNILGSMK